MLAAMHGWGKWIVLAPVFVFGIGLIAAVLILLGRAFADSMKDVKDKRIIVVGLVALVAVVAVLTYLGVSLPREE